MPTSSKAKGVLADFYQFSANDYGDYGDDFDSADNSDNSSVGGKKDKLTSARRHQGSLERDMTQTTAESIDFKKRKDESFVQRDYGRARQARTVTGSNRGKESRRMAYDSRSKPRSDRVVVKRVLSANRNKVNALQNLILELQNEVDQLRLENRDLKRTSRIQEKAIKKYDSAEAEIPYLIQKHNSEVRVLREKLKRQKGTTERSQEEMHRKDMEVQRLKDKVRKYEEIIKDKNLEEREVLQQKLVKLEDNLAEKESKILELERVVKLSEKARTRELKDKNEKYKKALDELKRLETMQKDLQGRFKEKEKELEVQNIYSQRITTKKKMNRPQPSSRVDDNFAPLKLRKSTTPNLQLEETLEVDIGIDTSIRKEDLEDSMTHRSEDSRVETMVSALRKQEEELERILEEERNRRKLEEDKIKLIEMEARIRMKEDEIRKAEKEKQEELDRKREEEKRLEEGRQKDLEKKKEEEERRRLIEITNRREKDLRIIHGLEKEVSAEVTGVLTEDAERNLMEKLNEQQERKRVLLYERNEDQNEIEQQRKKENLLAKLQSLDESKTSANKNIEIGNTPLFGKSEKIDSNSATPKVKSKPIFLESSRTGDDDLSVKHAPLDFRFTDKKRRGSKDYNFKKADENLHNGLPSHTDMTKQSKKVSNDVIFGEYSPTVHSAGKEKTSRSRRNDGKNKITDDLLFFESASEKSKEEESRENYPFFDTKKARDTKILPSEEAAVTQHRSKSNSANEETIQISQGTNPGRRNSDKGGKTAFGAYEPTFGNQSGGASTDVLSPDTDPFAEDGPRYGRRRGQLKKSALDGLPLSPGIENETSRKNLFRESEKKTETVVSSAVKAVNSFADDDIEEMVLI